MEQMFGIFNELNGTTCDWVPTLERRFDDKEISCISKCFIKFGKWNPAVAFVGKNNKVFHIDIDKSQIMNFDGGEEVDMSTMTLVELEYRGEHPETIKNKKIRRIRFDEPEVEEATSFDDPFGVK